MNPEYDIAVYIGRFQPFHQGHLYCVRQGLSIARQVIILVGSVNQARSNKNPWSFAERAYMIENSLSSKEKMRVIIDGIKDYASDQQWVAKVKSRVAELSMANNPRVALIGHRRDASSFYLDCFSDWTLVETGEYQSINATAIRTNYLNQGDIKHVSEAVTWFLQEFKSRKIFKELVNSNNTNKSYPPEVDVVLGSV